MTMTMTRTRARLLHAAADSLGDTAAIAVAAVAAVAAYRAVGPHRPAETRTAAALAAGALTAVLAEKAADAALTPLRRRLPDRYTSLYTGLATDPTPPTGAALARDAVADAAHRAAFNTYSLDHSGGSLRQAGNWEGRSDGTAVCTLAPGIALHYRPDHAELGTTGSADWKRRFELRADGRGSTTVVSAAQLHELMDRLAAGESLPPEAQPFDQDDPRTGLCVDPAPYDDANGFDPQDCGADLPRMEEALADGGAEFVIPEADLFEDGGTGEDGEPPAFYTAEPQL